MKTRRILLRPVSQEDYPLLFKWRNSLKYRTLVHYNDTVIDQATFLTEFKSDSKKRRYQYVIEHINTQQVIGIIFTHTFSKINGFCFINIYIDERFEKLGYGIDAFALLYCDIFSDPEFFKVYVEVFEYNKFSLSNVRNLNLQQEGRFIGHKRYNGERYDVFRYAGYRDLLPRFRKILDHFSEQTPSK